MRQLTPFTDPDEVLASVKPVSDAIHIGLSRLLPITKKWFEAQGAPVDKACHAMMTRVLLKRDLLEKQIAVSDEEDAEELRFRVEGLANCGLVINAANFVLRVLKSRNGELPLAGSRQRYDFYQGNLFTFEASDPFPDAPIPPLNLVAAWETDSDHVLRSLTIVCPLGQLDNHVQCKWGKTLTLAEEHSSPIAQAEPLPPEPTLDEITPKEPDNLRGERIKKLGKRDAETDGAN